ncbi:MAG TPA: hypothetical protein VFD58_22395 [Blastocatellia bacterium]|nr:hypothetical protein [Blastocatellia bacterium]
MPGGSDFATGCGPNLICPAAYVKRKREIIASGIIDSTDYSIKGEFVRDALTGAK